ncbi:protein kinase domain-containing protein [Actinomadura rupiterrae]|uniref:protein kinase domain-containing protein n=1 Tax=Actinomadura rupiterrae TaxID=559627 RepID=UPI0020A5131D|nr:cellulose binding domain-containing protein [Actinomadura rupiterrae]MCP2335937.1 serine/threonine-protein kinase [Actinomadura rupiterrae]
MDDPLRPGLLLGGRYRLEARVGDGGMASVWRAFDGVLSRPVAVKVPRADGLPLDGPGRSARRLRREATAAARLTHPGITGVYDYGEAEMPSGGRLPYVVMELLDGETLAARLARGPLEPREAAAVGAQIARALAAAHAAGVVHRDVKPANVMLTPSGVKVVDFGLAFGARPADAPASRAPGGAVLGTPAYVAPELLRGDDPTPAADVYALGVLLGEALPSPVPDGLSALVDRCLDADPARRPSAEEAGEILAAAGGLAPLTSGFAASQPPADAETGVIDRPPNPTRILDEPPPAGASRRPLIIGAGIAAVVLAVTGLIAALPAERKPAASSSPAPPRTFAPAEPSCAVAYAVTGQWPGGFQAQVRITNLGKQALADWRLAWTFSRGERITQIWNGTQQQSGADVTVTPADYDRSIAPNGSVDFGFLGTARSSAPEPRPESFAMNGSPCRQA